MKNGISIITTILFLSVISVAAFSVSKLFEKRQDIRSFAAEASCNSSPWDWDHDGNPNGACGPENDPEYGLGKCAWRNADPDKGKWFLCRRNPADGDLDWYGPCNTQTECLTQPNEPPINTPVPNFIPSVTPLPEIPTVTVTPLPTLTPGGPTPTTDPIVCIGGDAPCSRNGFNMVASTASQDSSYLNRFQTACNYLGYCANISNTCTNYNPLTPTPTPFLCSVFPTITLPTPIPTTSTQATPTVTPISQPSVPATPTAATEPSLWLPIDNASTTPLIIQHYMNQCDSAWRDVKVDPSNPTCPNSTICSIGCGQTDVAMILSQSPDTLVTPDTVSAWYRNNSIRQCGTSTLYPWTQGLDPQDLIKIFSSYGMQSQTIAFPNTGHGSEVADPHIQKQFKEEMVNYLNAGWIVIANTTQFSTDHEVIISQITADGDVMIYDPHSTIPQPAHLNGLGTLNGLFEIGFVIVK